MTKNMHYHIRWSGLKLDWERFSTREEAERVARELARAGEEFIVECVDDSNCTQCMKIYKLGLTNDKTGDSGESSQ